MTLRYSYNLTPFAIPIRFHSAECQQESSPPAIHNRKKYTSLMLPQDHIREILGKAVEVCTDRYTLIININDSNPKTQNKA